jgi:uncharacterized protein (TIGR03437 family)
VATLGNTPGTAQVLLSVGTFTYTFNLTVQVTVGGFTLVSGNNQTAVTNGQFGQPLVVKITDLQGVGIPGLAVNFSVVSGVASAATPIATTAADGTASTVITAGSVAGAIAVQATTTGQTTLTFNLTSRLPGPVVNSGQIVNTASFQPVIAPGALVTIYGTGIASGINGTVLGNPIGIGPLPTKVATVEVAFGTIAAPIYSVSNIGGQESVTVQVPYELVAPASSSITVRVNGSGTTIDNVQIKRFSPGIFEMTDSQNRRYAIVLKGDGSFVSPENPAARGEKLTIYCTGLGQLSPATFTNRLGAANQIVVAPIVVGVNNGGNGGAYTATLSPTLIGVYQIAFQLDANAAAGVSIPLSISVQDLDGTRLFSNSTNIAAIR